MKDAIYLDLALERGMTVVNGCCPENEIEDALEMIFGKVARPFIPQFENSLETPPRR